MKKYSKYKKQREKDQQTIESSDKLYRKSLQDNVIDKDEHKSLCNVLDNVINANASSTNEPFL